MRPIALLLLLSILPAACRNAPALPLVTAALGNEFPLFIGQPASISNTGLTVELRDVTDDARCPSDVECTESGPVTLIVSIRLNGNEPVEFIMESFTDYDGRAPEGPFEGIQDRVEYEGYLIQVKGVLPYPASPLKPIRDSEYRVFLLVEATR